MPVPHPARVQAKAGRSRELKLATDGGFMIRDHKVTFRSYQSLLAFVMTLRRSHGIDCRCEFLVTRLVECYVSIEPTDPPKTRLVLFEDEREPFFNRVQNTLHVNKDLWAEASIGEPLACFKLLHELAHILLHKHPEYSFSRAEHSGMAFVQDEESAEWQANVFAALFMAPPYLALDCHDRRSFVERFNYRSEFVDFWFQLRKRRPLESASSFCSGCGSQLIRVGSWVRCTNCGKTSKWG